MKRVHATFLLLLFPALFLFGSVTVVFAQSVCNYQSNGDTECSVPPQSYCVNFICQSVPDPTIYCNDPNGNDVYTRETVDYRYRDPSTGTFLNGSRTDVCEQNYAEVPSCTGSSCMVKEYNCNGPSQGQYSSSDQSCPNGCSDGACISNTPSLHVELGENDPGDHTMSEGDMGNNTMLQVKLKSVNAEPLNLKWVSLRASGTGNDASNIAEVFVAIDKNPPNGVYNPPETILGSGRFSADNGNLIITFNPGISIHEDSFTYLTIVYRMGAAFSGQTFALQAITFSSEDPSAGGVDVETSVGGNSSFSNTKTITSPISYTPTVCNYNSVRDLDETGVDCGGAYCPACTTTTDFCHNGRQDTSPPYDEQGIDCGGPYCPQCTTTTTACLFNNMRDTSPPYYEEGVDCGGPLCPSCVPSICETPSCDEGSRPICNDARNTVSICLSGIWMETGDAQLYSQYCPAQNPQCDDPDAFLCDPNRRSLLTCNTDTGQWENPQNVEPEYMEAIYLTNCVSTTFGGCESGDIFCPLSGGGAYACDESGVFAPYGGDDPEVQQACSGRECNPGEASCNQPNTEESPGSAWVCDDNGHWTLTQPEDWRLVDQVCGSQQPPSGALCTEGQTRCNFQARTVELCSDGVNWNPLITQDPAGNYQRTCADRVCNDNWFYCNPASSEVSFCDAAGQWGPGNAERFSELCEPSTVFLSGAPGKTERFGGSARDRLVIGDLSNNTITEIVTVPAKPAPTPFKFPEIPWWIFVVIAAGAAGTAAYYYRKYRMCAARKK